MPVRKQSYLYLRGMPDDSYRVTFGNYFMDVRGLEIEAWRLEFARAICNIKNNSDYALGFVIQELRLLLLNIEMFPQYYFLINQIVCV